MMFNYNQSIDLMNDVYNWLGAYGNEDDENIRNIEEILDKNQDAKFTFHEYGANPNIDNLEDLKRIIKRNQAVDVDIIRGDKIE